MDAETITAQAAANREAAKRGERPKSYPSPDVLRVDDVQIDGPDRVYDGENDSPDEYAGS